MKITRKNLLLCPIYILFLSLLQTSICFSTQANRGPVFLHEPPPKIHFSNSTGVVLPCSAHGTPPPAVSWLASGGTPIDDVSGVRKVHPNGSLQLFPFPPSAYRASIHAATYTCKASSPEGIIVSRPVRVRAVVRQFYEVQVYDEFVISGNTAVLKCHVPSFVRDYVTVTSWIRGNGGEIHSDIAKGGRYSIFPTGELHIRHVTKADEFQSYQCVTKHVLSKETATSAVAGRLMVNDPRSSVPPRITDSRASIRAAVGKMVELPCAAQGYPIPQYRWFKITGAKKRDHEIQEIHASERIRQEGGSLLFKKVFASDAGRYVCVVSSSVGEERTHTSLDVWAPLTAHITPQMQTVDVGGSAHFNCSAEGFPLENITWLKDGVPLSFTGRVRLTSRRRVVVQRVDRRDRGMYQCVVLNQDDAAQGSAQLKLGDASPIWLNTSGPQVVSPGAKVTLECHAQGSPPPRLHWTLRGQPVLMSSEHSEVDIQVINDIVVSRLFIPSVAVEDGGVWVCSASNRAGHIIHKDRLNVRGPPSIRPMAPTGIVAGLPTSFDCIVVGYPIDFIFWEKNGVVLPVSPRQTVHSNGTLEIRDVSKESDSGIYTCVATAGELSVKAKLNVSVMVPPQIDRSLFSWGNGYPLGSPARVMCVVLKGDSPLTFSWFHGEQRLEINSKLTIKYLDDMTSILLFHSVTETNSGNYTCQASNEVASDSASSVLLVKVAPTWKEQPMDISVVVGTTIKLPCDAHGAPAPNITWRKAQGGVPRAYVPIQILGKNVRVSRENKSLIIREIRRDQGGELLCIASNGVGSDLSKAVKVFVKVPPQFEMKEENVTVTAGNRATLSCLAHGNLPISIAWTRGSPPVVLSERDLESTFAITNTIINATQSELSPEMVLIPPSLRYYNSLHNEGRGISSSIKVVTSSRDDSNVFSCTAANVYGNDTKNINLIVQEVPMAVSSPKVTNTGSRSVNLSWNPPVHDGNSPITSYRVLVINSTDSWLNIGKIRRFEVSSTSMTIGGLKPAHSYLIRVLATNSVGTSPPSSELRFTTVHEPPTSPPAKVRVTPVSPTSIKVSWKMVDVPTSQLASYGYYVGHKLANTSDPVHYETKRPSTVSLHRQEAILTGLRKFRFYVITVQAFNDAGAGPKSSPVLAHTEEDGAGPKSPPVLAHTEEDVPEEPPRDVFCSSLSSTSILVKWNPPRPAFVNGILRGYKIFCVSGDDTKRQSATGTSGTLLGLTPYTNYSISVAAFTQIGTGVRSEPQFCLTDEDVPGPVTEVKGISVDRSSILVSWLPPSRPNGIILKYALTMRRHQSLSSLSSLKESWLFPPFPASHSVVDASLLEFNSPPHDTGGPDPLQRTPRVWHPESDPERSWIVPGNELLYLVSGLNERTSYSFNVRAATVVGEGPLGASVTQKPRHDPPPAIASFSRLITLEWGDEVRFPCKMVGSPTPTRRWTFNGERIEAANRGLTPRWEELEDGSLLLREVTLTSEGNYSCLVSNDHGQDRITYTLKVKDPPKKPAVYISDVTSWGITLRWQPPKQEENTQGYTIFMKREFGDWTQIEVKGQTELFEVSSLDCGVRYQVYVVAFNPLGTSEPSDIISTRTLGREPIVPTKAAFVVENRTSVGLQFGSWEDGGCPITSFVIEYQIRGSSSWRMVSNYVRWEESNYYVIKHLVPETAYVLRVTAHNSAGSSVATFPFSTHSGQGVSNSEDVYPPSTWIYDSTTVIVIIVSGIVVVSAGVVALFLSRRSVAHTNDRNIAEKGSATMVPEEVSPMNGTATLIRRKSMNILQAYVPPPSPTTMGGDTPTYYTFEMEAPRPSPLHSGEDLTLSEEPLYIPHGRRRLSGPEYSTLTLKHSPKRNDW